MHLFIRMAMLSLAEWLLSALGLRRFALPGSSSSGLPHARYLHQREAVLSTGHGSGGPCDDTLAAIITISNAYRTPHREELKETHNGGYYHLWKESEEARALLKRPPRGFPSSVSKSIIQPVIAEQTQTHRVLQRKILSHHLDFGFSNQYFEEICIITYVDPRKTIPWTKWF